MVKMELNLERVEDGTVRCQVVEINPDDDSETALIFDVTVNQEWTRDAQKAALRAVMRHLNEYIDLSQGGRC